MKTPKFTDLHRYPNGWRRAVETNVADTFARVRQRLEKQKVEREEIVRQLPKRSPK